jgi:hypothetical protein
VLIRPRGVRNVAWFAGGEPSANSGCRVLRATASLRTRRIRRTSRHSGNAGFRAVTRPGGNRDRDVPSLGGRGRADSVGPGLRRAHPSRESGRQVELGDLDPLVGLEGGAVGDQRAGGVRVGDLRADARAPDQFASIALIACASLVRSPPELLSGSVGWVTCW